MKKIFNFIFSGVGKIFFIAFAVILVSCGLYALTNDSYTAGKNSIHPQFVEQTLAIINLNNAANPIPAKTVVALAPPSSPANSTSAQAVPSG